MFEVKESIKDFKSYKPNTVEYDTKLDANESRTNETLLLRNLSLDSINRYPDHYTIELRKKIALLYNRSYEEVIVGNGSSELLELVTKTFVNPKEVVLSVEPSFVMYEKYTKLSGGIYKTVKTNEYYELDIDEFIREAIELRPKLIFLCTPNNPTGSIIKKEDVLRIVKSTDAYIVVDEAYMEFSESDESVIDSINEYPNLMINRTFSKAFALAGARLGYFIANKELINTLYIAKTPYSVTTLSQQLGLEALKDLSYLNNNVKSVVKNRKELEKQLQLLGIRTYESNANFIFCKYTQKDIKKELEAKRILIRGFGNGLYRITVGTKAENNILLQALEEIL